jgi:hypothetical protein
MKHRMGLMRSGGEEVQLMNKEETKSEKASVREATVKEIKNPELRGLVNEWVRSMNKIIKWVNGIEKGKYPEKGCQEKSECSVSKESGQIKG